MKKCLFIGILFIFFTRLAGAEERHYINIGGNPVEPEMCQKRNLETYKITEDKYSVITDKDRNLIIGWIKAGEEIGKLPDGKEVVCRCGNKVKFLEFAETKVVVVEKEKEVCKDSGKKKIIVIINKTEPVVMPMPVERPRPVVDYGGSWGWSPTYSGGYYSGGTMRWVTVDTDHRGFYKKPKGFWKNPPNRPRPHHQPQPQPQPQPRHPSPPVVPHPNPPHVP
ncbi:MAG: hypothetical protein V1808_04815 [Candidatus Daviesbacteria bacterium]